MKILSKLFKRKSKQTEDNENETIFTDEEWELMHAKADVEAVKIYRKIYSLFKEHINELKEGDNFILLQENPIKLCDDKLLNQSIKWQSLNNSKKLRELIPELDIRFGKEIKTMEGTFLGFETYYLYTVNITHNNIIELYDIKFRVHRSRQQINNGDEICVTVYDVDKNIYKIV